MLSHRPFLCSPTMLHSFSYILAAASLAQALTPARDGDVLLTKTVTSTHYVCPCDSTTTWAQWAGSKSGTGSLSSGLTNSLTSGFTYSTSLTSTRSGYSGNSTVTSFSGTTSTTTTGTSTTPTTSAVPSFYFAAYGNGFVADGTSLGDETTLKYAALNNANTAFVVNSTGALIDPANGRVAVVARTATNPIIMFLSQAEIDATYATCNCAVSGSFLSCNCNGLTAFAAGADTYLHIQSSAVAKRGNIAARQSTTANSGVSMSATPVPSSGTSSTATTTTSSCVPSQTFLIQAYGSTNEFVADGTYLIERVIGTSNDTLPTFTNTSNFTPDPILCSLDPCTGYLRENTYGGYIARTNATGRYNNLFFSNATSGYIPCVATIATNNALSLDCTGGYNQIETDSGGNLNIANVNPNATTGDYVVYPRVSYASTVPTFPTYTASACASPTPTFNVISNGSTFSNSITNKTSPYGTFMYQYSLPGENNKTAGSFGNDTAPGVYTIDPCTGAWTERSSGRNQVLTVYNFNQTTTMQWADPGVVKPGYNAYVCKCSIASTGTSYIGCDCGYGRTLYALYGDRNWILTYAPGQDFDGLSYIQPIAQLLN